ncbi:unnamed protein product [Ixodes pacificus]
MAQSHLSPPKCLERKKATGAIFEKSTRDYLHLAAVVPSATTALATKKPALRQIPHGLDNTRGTMNVKMLLFVIQIMSHLKYGPVPFKPAQLPGAKKKNPAPSLKLPRWIICISPRWRHRQRQHWLQKSPALRQIAHGLSNTCGMIDVKLLLFVIQVGEAKQV